jgi:hypothetical protein
LRASAIGRVYDSNCSMPTPLCVRLRGPDQRDVGYRVDKSA